MGPATARLGAAERTGGVPVRARLRRATELVLPPAALVAVGLVLVGPLRRSDLLVFLRAAHDVAQGTNPYTALHDPFVWGGSAYVYPFLTAFLFVPLTWVPVAVADLAWFALSGAAAVLACRLLGLRDTWGITAVLLSATCIRSLQVGSLNLVLLLAAATLWRHRDRAAVAAPALALLAGSKLFLLPVALWVLLTRPRRTVLACGAALGGFLGLSLLLQPVSAAQFLTETRLLAEHEGPHSMSVLRLATHLLTPSTARFVPLLLAGAVLVGGIAYQRRRRDDGDRVLFASALVASLVATPIYWSHYTVLVAVVVLLASPTRTAAVLFSGFTWLVAQPVLTHQLSWPLDQRLVLLYGGMLAALVATARRTVPPAPAPVSPEEPTLATSGAPPGPP